MFRIIHILTSNFKSVSTISIAKNIVKYIQTFRSQFKGELIFISDIEAQQKFSNSDHVWPDRESSQQRCQPLRRALLFPTFRLDYSDSGNIDFNRSTLFASSSVTSFYCNTSAYLLNPPREFSR